MPKVTTGASLVLLGATLLTAGCAAVKPQFRVERGSARVSAPTRTAPASLSASARSSARQDAWDELLTNAGLTAGDERPVQGSPLTARGAALLLRVLLKKPVTLSTFPPRMVVGHLLRQVLAEGTLSREELLRRVARFSRVAVLRPDGYLAWARSGRTQQKTVPLAWRDGVFRAGSFELGRFYISNGFSFRLANEQLEAAGHVLAEVHDDADYLSRSLDGAQAAFFSLALAIGQFATHPWDSLASLKELPSGIAALIASSPGYFERFRYMTRGEQVQAVAELVTNLVVTAGAASGATRTVTNALAGVESTVPVLSLSMEGALAVEQLAVPVGRAATVLGGGPGAVIILQRARTTGGGPPPPGGPGRWKPANEHMPEAARRYQAQVTQGPEGHVYVVDDVKFDGFKDEVLLETKGPGYAEHVADAAENGGWFQGFRDMVRQARRQRQVAGDYPIQWHFAEREAADFVRELFENQGLGRIKVIHTPPVP